MTFASARDSGVLGGTLPSVARLIDKCAESAACRRVIARGTSFATARRWLSESQTAATGPLPSNPFYVWVWLEYAQDVPRRMRLNFAALRRHVPAEATVVVLNASTVARWVVLPPEFSRLRHKVAASDVARVALLATHGGLYLDADVLVAEPLAPLLSLLHAYESIVYASWGQVRWLTPVVGPCSAPALAAPPSLPWWVWAAAAAAFPLSLWAWASLRVTFLRETLAPARAALAHRPAQRSHQARRGEHLHAW